MNEKGKEFTEEDLLKEMAPIIERFRKMEGRNYQISIYLHDRTKDDMNEATIDEGDFYFETLNDATDCMTDITTVIAKHRGEKL